MHVEYKNTTHHQAAIEENWGSTCLPDAVMCVRLYPSILFYLFLFPFRRQCLREVRITHENPKSSLDYGTVNPLKVRNVMQLIDDGLYFDILLTILTDVLDKFSQMHLPLAREAMFAKTCMQTYRLEGLLMWQFNTLTQTCGFKWWCTIILRQTLLGTVFS